jgi:phage shock protein PspC (stress-responsive transcriptional regulator)
MDGGRDFEEDTMNRTRGLRRSRQYRILGGVCGGIAEWLGWRPTMVRVLYVVLSILSVGFPGIVVYIILWLVMPEEERATA